MPCKVQRRHLHWTPNTKQHSTDKARYGTTYVCMGVGKYSRHQQCNLYILDHAYSLFGSALIAKWNNGLPLTSSFLPPQCEKCIYMLQAYFALENYSEALTSFKSGQNLCRTEQINFIRGYDMWIRECEKELHAEKEQQQKQVFTSYCLTFWNISSYMYMYIYIYICYSLLGYTRHEGFCDAAARD